MAFSWMGDRARRSTTTAQTWRWDGGRSEEHGDLVATEEPLEIRLIEPKGRRRTVALTMRTPGADRELALGFLFAEGIVGGLDDVVGITTGDFPEAPVALINGAEVELVADLAEALPSLERHFFATSACGVCGKAGLEALSVRGTRPIASGLVVDPAVISSLPEKLRAAQGVFATTGGLHAAALFDREGHLLAVREDVGRHNALDKLIGWGLETGAVPFHDRIVMVSGRSSYEILQKSLAAGAPIVAAVSAPSSLAVELARRFGVTLLGFVRGSRFNVYSAPERLAAAAPAEKTP